MAFVSVLLISLACVALSYFILNYRRQLLIRSEKRLRGPKAFPLFGNVHYLLQIKSIGFLDTLLRLAKDYSSPLRFWLGPKLYVFIYQPDQIKIILQNNHCLAKSEIYKLFEPVFGTGLLTASVSIWIKKRKIFEQGFNRNMIRKYFDTFVEQSLLFADELERVGLNGREIDLIEDIFRCTLNIALSNITGIKLELQSNILSVWIKMTMRLREIIRYRMYNIFMYPDIIFNLTSLGREQRENINIANSCIDEIIQRANALKLDTSESRDKTFFQIIFEAARDELSAHQHIRYDIITMVMGASETITTTINFVIFMLANFSEVQDKIYKELMEIYGLNTPKSMPVKYTDLHSMVYLECVIKETMRLFPSIPAIGRHIEKDLEMGEFILPKGTEILILFLKIHRNEKYWPNPLVFNPDRFLPKNLPEDYLNYYFPFSSGLRNCIGMKYGMISMKVLLATLIRTFVFEVDERIDVDKIKFNMDVTAYSPEPLKVRIVKRGF